MYTIRGQSTVLRPTPEIRPTRTGNSSKVAENNAFERGALNPDFGTESRR